DELQQILDHALQRDAADRYQSAAQFGREFAAAISAMPATKAMEEGTLIVGAVGAPKGGEVPATRVRASAATAPMEAPAAARRAPAAAPAAAGVERRRSNTPVIAGTGVLLAGAIAAFVWLKPMSDPAPVPTGPAAAGDSVSP